jgi:uncharacterized repeat protein (TIGR01451 family)
MVVAGSKSSFADVLTITGGTGPGTLDLVFSNNGVISGSGGESGTAQFQYTPVAGGQPVYPIVSGPSTTTIPIGFTFGVPMTLYVELDVEAEISSWVSSAASAGANYLAQLSPPVVPPCCSASSLTQISVQDSQGSPVTSFNIKSESQAVYTPSGMGPQTPGLSVAAYHAGNFIPGQTGTYAITVSNGIAAANTSGDVTVTENLPAGLSLVSMSGNGWTCVSNTCTSTSALSPGSTSTPIYVTVNVASGYSGQVTNVVNVSGGGSAANTVSNPTMIGQTSPCDIEQNGDIDVSDVQLIINAALGGTTAVNDLNGDGSVNVVDVQIEIDAAMGLGCNGASTLQSAVSHRAHK